LLPCGARLYVTYEARTTMAGVRGRLQHPWCSRDGLRMSDRLLGHAGSKTNLEPAARHDFWFGASNSRVSRRLGDAGEDALTTPN
jgi:hypothetical protein